MGLTPRDNLFIDHCWAVPHRPTKACACPASRPKKKPGVSDKDINGLMDGGAYTSEARSWSNRGAGHGSSLHSQGVEGD